MTEKIWRLPDPVPAGVEDELDLVPRLLRPVLFARGIRSRREAEVFLSKATESLHDPYDLPDMEVAVDLVLEAVRAERQIVIYGDYDADGITGTALLVRFLRSLEADVSAYTPDRFTEGYGLNLEAVEHLAERADLMITVDCGTRALEEVQRAVDLGMKVIVTDHHHPGPRLPPAQALINPRRASSSYPFEDLAGVGLAYKLAQAIAQELPAAELNGALELVALGTVADLTPLRGENRVLVAEGLRALNKTEHVGLRALMDAARVRQGSIGARDIGFGLGPRLNAAGRMRSAELGVQLLLEGERNRAGQMAGELDRINRARQEETRRTVEKARSMVEEKGQADALIFAADEGFHQGVVGLAASRLAEDYYRPAIVAHREGGIVKASARSIPKFHITEALEACRDMLLHFGGHAAAAGFTARAENVPELVERLRAQAQAAFDHEPPRPEIHVDAVVSLSDLGEDLLEQMEAFEPFGQGNEPPLFAAFGENLVDARAVGKGSGHLKMTLRAGHQTFDAIGFRLGERVPHLSQRVDVAFHYEWNEYKGYVSPQLRVLDVRASESGGRG